MIGKAGGFAVFPDCAIGHRALLDLLLNEYGDFDLFKLMDNAAYNRSWKVKALAKSKN